MILDRGSWLALVVLFAIGGVIWGLFDTRRTIQAPFLYATGLGLIVAPQVYVAVVNPWRVPDQAFEAFCLMVVLCSAAMYAGYVSRARPAGTAPARFYIDDRRLFTVAMLVGCAGVLGSLQLWRMGNVVEWRGWPVYWATLSRLNLAGIALLLYCYTRSGKVHQLLLALLICVFPASEIFNSGRRTASLLLPVTLIAPFVLSGKLRIPRGAVLLGLFFAFIVIYAFPYWRDRFGEDAYVDIVRDVPLSQVIAELFAPGSRKVLEIIDAMLLVGAHDITGKFSYGLAALYNNIVEHYVPGSLLGHAWKDGLRLGEGVSIDWVRELYPVGVAYYTAKTGFSDLFGEFYYFGAIVVFFVGRLFAAVACRARYERNPRAEIFLCLFLAFPGIIPYSPFFFFISTQLPQLAIFAFVSVFCIRRETADAGSVHAGYARPAAPAAA